MVQPDFEGSKKYALDRLERELPSCLVYHSISHTRDEVVPAVERLAGSEGVRGEPLELLITAAYFHDIGFLKQYFNNEPLAVDIASQVLPGFGFTAAQLRVIRGIILATHLPQTPRTLLEKILADADMDVLGRDDFLDRNHQLRLELAAFGITVSDKKWFENQITFMQEHHYFTRSAQQLRDAKKQANFVEMINRLETFYKNEINHTRRQNMISTNEHIVLLRSVNLFSETPDDILAQVAVLLEPVNLKEGETLFDKGDTGDRMYIIVQGHLRVHDGELVLNHLGPADVVGEMALLDSEPRLASVTAIEDTSLLSLGQQPFYQLMANHIQVARGVIRVITRYLRSRVRDMAEDFEYIRQVGKITSAAAALEAGVYSSEILGEVTQRSDELGQLARVFRGMANEVEAREQRLRKEVIELRIQIDEANRAKQVSEITESEYFQQLKEKISVLRKK